MLWGDTPQEIIETKAADRGLAFVVASARQLPENILKALHLAGLDIVELPDVAACLTRIPDGKPDLIVFVSNALACPAAEFQKCVERARTTETLPVLECSDERHTEKQPQRLATNAQLAEAFLIIRAVLRRERPSALKDKRCCGALVLDELGFKLLKGEKSATLTKTDFCILGPFFDVKNAVFARRTLEQLAFETDAWKVGSRTIVSHVSRTRRSIKKQLGIDPLRPVRGVGYALSMDTPSQHHTFKLL